MIAPLTDDYSMNLATERNYDLHCHSTSSDGELSPTALVQHAARQGVQVMALTDHDVTDGLAEAAAEAEKLGIGFITGVEISVTWQKHLIHIVGLNFDPANEALQQGLAGLRQKRQTRGDEIAQKLAKLGIEDALAGAQGYANGEILSRTHFAKFLVESGRVKTFQAAFDRYLATGKPAYAACEWCTLEEALGWIQGAGGVAVIAHPARYKLSATKLRALIGDFKALGGQGFEVISGSQGVQDNHNMADYARRHELQASVGSDYHGPSQTWLGMGRIGALPEGLVPVWHDWGVATAEMPV